MRRLLTLALIPILLLTAVQQVTAQSLPYRLYTPTAEEYLTALPGLAALAKSEDTGQNDPDLWTFQQITTNELRANYSDLRTVNFDTLYSASSAVNLTTYDLGPYSEYGWYHRLMDTWLRENKVDLSTQKQWKFRGFTLDITPVDFNGDGQPELIVELTYEEGGESVYNELMVMQRNNAAPGKYSAVKLPWPFWYSAYCGVHDGCGGGAQTFKLADLNGDGLPEWAVASHSCGYGECGGGLSILGWRHGEMVDLAQANWPNGLFWTGVAGGGGGAALPPDGTWIFQVNAADEHQIVQRYQFQDNRDCAVTYTNIFTWNRQKDRFIPDNLSTTYVDTAQCALRRGQEAMESGDNQQAAEAYQRAVDLMPFSGESYADEALQYAEVRLALAYALSRQADRALALVDRLRTEAPKSEPMRSLLNAVDSYHGDGDRVQLCVDVFHATNLYDPYSNRDTTDFWTFGQTDDVQGRGMYLGGDFGPDVSGCDIKALLTEVIGQLHLASNVSPSAAMDAAGIKIAQTFTADFNGDGKPDWLFWLNDLPDQALLLLSNGNHFDFSMPSIVSASDKVQLSVVKLPNGAKALASLGFNNLSYWEPDSTWPCGKDVSFGSLDLAGIAKGTLQSVGSYLLCEPRTLAQIFQSQSQLHAWNETDYNKPAVETTFTWNTKGGTYDPPPVAPDLTTQLEQTCNQPYGYCGFDLTNPAALSLLNKTLATPPQDATPVFLAAVRYTRAITYLKQGNNRAALSDFVELYRNAPNDAWKGLAALHLRKADGTLLDSSSAN